MDLKTVVTEVGSWPVEDRLKLMDEIWAGLLDQSDDSELTDTQLAELHRRVADDDRAPDDVVTWDLVKAEALKRARR